MEAVGSTVLSAPLVSAFAASKGDCLVPETPAGPRYILGTTANRGGRRCHGIALFDGRGSVMMRSVGIVTKDISGILLQVGNAEPWLRVNTLTGRLERIAQAAIVAGDEIVGWCEEDGMAFVAFGILSAQLATGGSGGGVSQAYVDAQDTATLALAETYADAGDTAEATARAGADTAEATTRANDDATLAAAIVAEAGTRATDDTTEATARAAADTAEATTRAANDATEAAARVAGDAATLTSAQTYVGDNQGCRTITIAASVTTHGASSSRRACGSAKVDMSLYPATIGTKTRKVRFVADVQKTSGATSVECFLYDVDHNADVSDLTHNANNNVTQVSSGVLTEGSAAGNLRTDAATLYEAQIIMNGGVAGVDQVTLSNAALRITYE